MQRQLLALIVSSILATSSGCGFIRCFILGLPPDSCGPYCCPYEGCNGGCGGCGAAYWGDHSAYGRGCEPCDRCGNWTGPTDGNSGYYEGAMAPSEVQYEGDYAQTGQSPQPTPARTVRSPRPEPSVRRSYPNRSRSAPQSALVHQNVREGDVIYDTGSGGGYEGEVRDVQWSEGRADERQMASSPRTNSSRPVTRAVADGTPTTANRVQGREWSPDRPKTASRHQAPARRTSLRHDPRYEGRVVR
jgi:hypothetical protein